MLASSLGVSAAGCYTGIDEGLSPDFCETGGTGGAPPDGAWDTDYEDWSDPGAPGNDGVFNACGVEQILAHHCWSSPVHAVHTSDGRVLLMHGQSDQRLWRPGNGPESIGWHPVPYDREWPPSDAGVVDLFCAGHSQLADGRILFAGGNINGSPAGGGLRDTFRFDPANAEAATSMEVAPPECPFGWEIAPAQNGYGWANQSDSMAYDRWYPTLTTLPDGRVLIAGGTSRAAGAGGALCADDTECAPGEICLTDRGLCDVIDPNAPCPTRASAACEADGDCSIGVCIDGVCGCFDDQACGSGTCEGADVAQNFPGRCRCAADGDCDDGVCNEAAGACVCPAGQTCYGPENTCQIMVDAETTRVLEVYDPSQPPGQQITQLPALFPATSGVPSYPFMFVLPNGDVLYAGAEAITAENQVNGQVLRVDYDDIEQSEWVHTIESDITGGSAVMYRPGMVLKSGGCDGDNVLCEEQIAGAEIVDLRGYPAGDYAAAPTAFEPIAEMNFPRHFHNLTVLPDGRVLATGGQEFGNSEPADHFNHPCEYGANLSVESRSCAQGCYSECIEWTPEIGPSCGPGPSELTCSLMRAVPCNDDETCDALLDGATCVNGSCNRECATLGESCGFTSGCGPDDALESPRQAGQCGALNHACYATKVPELWTPGSCEWEPLLDQEETYERMYHSTALLLPDTRVVSMGNGHRDLGDYRNHREGFRAQYFAPQYADDPSAVAPVVSLPEFGLAPDGPLDGMPRNYLPWNGADLGTIDIVVENDVDVRGASLIRLGSNTHGFDMDQRWVPMRTAAPPGASSPVRVFGGLDNSLEPFNANVAPPGHYMLFLLSEEGEPSNGVYVRVGPDTDFEYVCEASELLALQEESCTVEPISGVCPPGEELLEELDLATVPSGAGMVPGFRVIAPAGLVADHAAPTATDSAALGAICARACTDYVQGRPGVTANCDDEDVFAAIEPDEEGLRASELIRADQRHGEDLFASGTLSCDLVTECHEAFDEVLAAHGPRRVSPAPDPLAVSTEWMLGLNGSIGALSSHSQGQVTASMTGEIAYASCTAGNASAPCPFYLGDLSMELTQPLTLALSCDGATETHVLSSLSLSLSQPAFGMAEQGTFWRAFPPGALVFDASGVVDGVPFSMRRPTQEPVYIRALNGWSQLQGPDGAWLEFAVPCGEDEVADVLVWWTYGSVSVEEHPPYAEINVPDTVPCPSTVTLTKAVSDADGDLASVRWFVDGVLMEDGITQLAFTQGHELRLVATDARGATRTDVEVKTCQ